MRSLQEDFRRLLQTHRQSVTAARVAIFEALVGQEPLTMQELVGRVPAVDRASVYRTVELLERLGVVYRLYSGWKYKLELSDKLSEHHHHLTCTNCERTIAMNESDLEALIARLAQTHHFKPSAHQIEIQGLCDRCQ